MPYPSASGTWGSTAYLLAIAREARRRGHEVQFHACPPSSRLLIQNGFTVREFDGARSDVPPGPIRDVYDAFTALRLDDPDDWRRLLDLERDVIASARPDVVISDIRPTATISARRCGVPLVAMASVGTDPRLQARPGGHPLDDLARALAGPYLGTAIESFPELLFWTADRKIASSFQGFEPELSDVPGLSYVGYLDSTNRRGADTLPDRPERLVIAYLSTVGWNSPVMMRSLIRTAELAGLTVWCVTNANGSVERAHDRLLLFDYLPVDELLPECGGLLFHGGQGTALGSLFHAVPSIACPGENYERRYNASRIDSLGCGVHASVMDLRPRVLAGLMAGIIDNPAFRTAARSAGAELRSLRGTRAAVDVVESAAQ